MFLTDKAKIRILTDAMATLMTASMGEPSLYAETYEAEVKAIARGALIDVSDVTPQD